jgi:hypothetical protein
MKVNAAAWHMPSRSPHLITCLTFSFLYMFLFLSILFACTFYHYYIKGKKKSFYPLVSLVVGPPTDLHEKSLDPTFFYPLYLQDPYEHLSKAGLIDLEIC